jgi:hypothetical protein
MGSYYGDLIASGGKCLGFLVVHPNIERGVS